MRRLPSKVNGLVTTPTVRMPALRAAWAMTGAAPVPRAAAHAGGDETHMRAGQVIHDLVERFLGRGAADLWERSGAQSFGDVGAELNQPRRLRHGQRLGIGVGGDELGALELLGDHVVDRVATAAAHPDHGDLGPHLGDFRLFVLGHACFSFVACPIR
jgi:hypothetical protein